MQVFVSPGASATGPLRAPHDSVETPASPSETNTFASVTLPVFVAVNV